MKTISIDGKALISGSANKDQTTMYGSFREEQLQVFDPRVTRIHDDGLMRFWNDSHASTPFDGFDFKVPYDLVGPSGKKMTPREFISAVRGTVTLIYDATVH